MRDESVSNPPNSPESRRERVAVIAVHGVGKHEPGSSAQGMADLLLGINAFTNPLQGSPYQDFNCEKIEVPLPGPSVFEQSLGKPATLWDRARTVFEERRGFFADRFRLKNWRGGRAALGGADINDEFTVTQLGEYSGDPLVSKYESVRLRGTRAGTKDSGSVQVDLYEMYWADLAKRNNSFVRFFMSLYQLMIHLASLGRTAIDHVSLEHAGSMPWLLLQRSYNYATRVLSLGLFNFLVLLPVVAFAPLTHLLSDGQAKTVAATLLAIAAAGLVGWALSKTGLAHGKNWVPFLVFGILLFAAAGGTAWAANVMLVDAQNAVRKDLADAILSVAWWIGAFGVCYYIFSSYDQVRAGAKESGVISTLVVAAGFVACLVYNRHIVAGPPISGLPQESHAALVYNAAAFMMLQYVFLLLRFLWAALVLLAVFSYAMEFVCLRMTKAADERARARAAFRTGRFALAMPTLLLLLVTMFAWSGVFYYTWYHVPLYKTSTALPEAPLWKGISNVATVPRSEFPCLLLEKRWEQREQQCQHTSVNAESKAAPLSAPDKQPRPYAANRRQLQALLLQSAPVGLPGVLLLMALGFLLLILLAAPSALQEAQHPIIADNQKSRVLGDWLSGAFCGFPAIIYCFWLAAFGLPFVYILAATISYFTGGAQGFSWMYHLYTWHFHLFTVNLALKSGPLVTAGAIFMATAGKAIFKSASTILDTVLDVDNYLRTSPSHNTPRARVVERYVGLLRFVNERGYDRVVIVAHSLGSLISADLLRFLNHRKIETLSEFAYAGNEQAPIPIRLFTMGSPLRQLLNRFFPNLYMYIRPVPDDTGEPAEVRVHVSQPPAPTTIPQAAAPEPRHDLGLDIWANYYRSGDYVGRAIWLDGWMQRTRGAGNDGAFPNPPMADCFTDNDGIRQEACIGLGAHTHYWDRSAPDVALMLDQLIVSKAGGAAKPQQKGKGA
ncbi:MAG TPA: hypothetical protein VHN74_21145 [Candidatus Angelobacter sp.]|nr:hypothetical protein [Candidatus Angelobacter sp.]